ncbi:hypothetical protein PGTUg99_035896 [Puccinia graminis f. sp. tritici]|uniref:C2H2-type domain-containing protein n=2 Tax=Puccinia graminis f. sp. tritici TaxID=56615 RepID=E3KXX2_PUCGT|nr:uncharacterized protein PGTG_14899 [Puccinia graminis f. sp. tritici CRL 75-36-700-3]EFP89058.2 hypothetical protein PGTG_14899 [Puccinia graminis f. sp. tritici CRL 75-36-700-3]KAA1095947.1 hypothetical protein PGTUg99_035896 [Puccinia graminis f. sp. tritici]
MNLVALACISNIQLVLSSFTIRNGAIPNCYLRPQGCQGIGRLLSEAQVAVYNFPTSDFCGEKYLKRPSCDNWREKLYYECDACSRLFRQNKGPSMDQRASTCRHYNKEPVERPTLPLLDQSSLATGPSIAAD